MLHFGTTLMNLGVAPYVETHKDTVPERDAIPRDVIVNHFPSAIFSGKQGVFCGGHHLVSPHVGNFP